MPTVCPLVFITSHEKEMTKFGASVLVTGQIAKEINTAGKQIEKLYDTLSEDVLSLQ